MDKNEWYRRGQKFWVKENDVKVGDKVRALRLFSDNELGCATATSENGNMARFVRDRAIGTISKMDSDSIRVDCGNDYCHSWWWPFFVLEIVDQPRDVEIELRYFKDGKDVTDEISDETKRNLAKV